MTYSNPIVDHLPFSDELTPADRIATLTPTQLRVLGHVAAGAPNKRIAFELGITEATVKVHISALMRKLEAQNRTQVALAARESGFSGQ